MSKTREEIKRANRRWFAVRLVVFLAGAAAFFLILIGTGYLADTAAALIWKG